MNDKASAIKDYNQIIGLIDGRQPQTDEFKQKIRSLQK
jgi:ferritin-like protein